MKKLVLFDIDGTLLWTDGAGRRAIHAALTAEAGVAEPADQVRFDGKTDPQIVAELLAAAGYADAADETRIRAVCRRYLELLGGELSRSGGQGRLRVLPGVHALLDRLEARHDAVLGLLTGNLAEGARLKLSAAGLDPARFRVGAFGSDAAARSALPPIAAERALAIMGRRPAGDEIILIGDTPNDMTCGRALAVRAIGVATGSYSTDELLASGGYAAFGDLGDLDAVLEAIYA